MVCPYTFRLGKCLNFAGAGRLRRAPKLPAFPPPFLIRYNAAELKPADLADIIAYLRTVPPLH
jgi:hypothetical protein